MRIDPGAERLRLREKIIDDGVAEQHAARFPLPAWMNSARTRAAPGWVSPRPANARPDGGACAARAGGRGSKDGPRRAGPPRSGKTARCDAGNPPRATARP